MSLSARGQWIFDPDAGGKKTPISCSPHQTNQTYRLTQEYTSMMVSSLPHFPFDDQTRIISDTHFLHTNIGRYCDRPDGWQETIIHNWNRLIQPEEMVFHIGDLALGKTVTLCEMIVIIMYTMIIIVFISPICYTALGLDNGGAA